MTHTPGPWVADAIAENGDIRIGCIDLPLVIASVHNGASIGEILNGLPPELQWANARLIAAAPDLLVALHGMIGLIQLIVPTLQGSQRIGVEQNHRLEAAIAAITKATGSATA